MKHTCETLVRQVIIIRGDYPGPVAEQAADIARASIEGVRSSQHRSGNDWTGPWIEDGMKITVLEAKDGNATRHAWFEALKRFVPVGPVRDSEGNLNALAIGPAPVELVRELSQGFPVMGAVDDN